MKYKVGDKVRIKSLDWYNYNKDVYGDIWCGAYVFTYGMSKFCGEIVTIKTCYKNDCYTIKEDDRDYTFTLEMIEEHVDNKMLIGWIKESNIYRLVPDKDYEIKYDEKGFFYLKKKEKEYPKTYEECCGVIGINRHDVEIDIPQSYQQNMFNLFKLLICRDAYWKMAGEEMGLGKPWEPDWTNEQQDKYGFYNEVKYTIINPAIFVFPTKEMRDAFYENFKELIESVKELL